MKQTLFIIVLCAALLATAGVTAVKPAEARPVSTTVVVNFDDLGPALNYLPPGYAGLTWSPLWWSWQQWGDPYNAHSSPNWLSSYEWETGARWIGFPQPVTFGGAWFSGSDNGIPVYFEGYLNGVLVGTSASLYMTSTPTFLAANFGGPIDKVVVVGDNDYFVLDDLTYATGPTKLTISVNPTNPLPNQRIDLYGTLTTGPGVTRLANQPVYLEQSADGGITWTLVSTTPATTTTGGVYAFYGAVPNQPGTYLYRAHFYGTAQYAECYSTPLTFTIPQRATQLSIAQVPVSSAPKQPVNVIGNLTTAGAGMARLHNQKLYLEQSTDGGATWNLVSNTPATTINGAYSFLAPIKVPGTYLVRTHFNGTVQYGESWSSQLTLTVK